MKVFYLVDAATGYMPLGSDYIFVKREKKTNKITKDILDWKNRIELFKGRKYELHVVNSIDELPNIIFDE